MSDVREHYEALLAEHYTWSLGDFDEAVERESARLFRAGISPTRGETAIDLGAGSGVHSVALARLGYSVVAVDLSPTLLAELGQRKGHLDIRPVEADLRTLGGSTPSSAALITCMGDTLLHLPSKEDVRELLQAAHLRLSPGGQFVASFRDLTGRIEGPDRVIQVAADADRILTCFLEPHPDHVTVHDILHERMGKDWRTRTSCYDKLRLSSRWLEGALREVGFHEATVAEDVRMLLAAARR